MLGVVTINGTDDGNDGWIVVGAAVVGAIVLGLYAWRPWRWVLVVALVAGLAGAVTAGYDINNIGNLSNDNLLGSGLTSKKWGIYLSLVASISLALASIGVFVEARRAQSATPAAG